MPKDTEVGQRRPAPASARFLLTIYKINNVSVYPCFWVIPWQDTCHSWLFTEFNKFTNFVSAGGNSHQEGTKLSKLTGEFFLYPPGPREDKISQGEGEGQNTPPESVANWVMSLITQQSVYLRSGSFVSMVSALSVSIGMTPSSQMILEWCWVRCRVGVQFYWQVKINICCLSYKAILSSQISSVHLMSDHSLTTYCW